MLLLHAFLSLELFMLSFSFCTFIVVHTCLLTNSPYLLVIINVFYAHSVTLEVIKFAKYPDFCC